MGNSTIANNMGIPIKAVNSPVITTPNGAVWLINNIGQYGGGAYYSVGLDEFAYALDRRYNFKYINNSARIGGALYIVSNDIFDISFSFQYYQ